MTKTKKEKVVSEPIVEKSDKKSDAIKALKALFAAQKLSTPMAYESQKKDEELERRIKAL